MTNLTGWNTQFSTSQNPIQTFYFGNWSINLTAGKTGSSNVSPYGASKVWENVTQASVSITIVNSSIYLPLNPEASPTTNSSMAFIVSTNTGFTITVVDSSGRSAGDQGYMGNYTTSYQTSPLNTKLASALALSGTTNGTTAAGIITPPITTSPQTLYAGTAKVSTQYLFNTFSQPITYDDGVLPTGSVYRVDLQFTITST
jgi:hypothetical protein